MNLTDQTLSDIGNGIYSPMRTPERASQGPHRWHEMTGADFASRWDFELEDHKTLVIFEPISEAALQWCYAHLPADCPRFGAKGFLIEAEHIKGVVGGARRDNLMTEADYIQAMEEMSQQTQWDGQI